MQNITQLIGLLLTTITPCWNLAKVNAMNLDTKHAPRHRIIFNNSEGPTEVLKCWDAKTAKFVQAGLGRVQRALCNAATQTFLLFQRKLRAFAWSYLYPWLPKVEGLPPYQDKSALWWINCTKICMATFVRSSAFQPRSWWAIRSIIGHTCSFVSFQRERGRPRYMGIPATHMEGDLVLYWYQWK
jgi:hypothetical protein